MPELLRPHQVESSDTEGDVMTTVDGVSVWQALPAPDGLEVQQDGDEVEAPVTVINFTGDGVTVTSPSAGQVSVAIAGASGGGGGGLGFPLDIPPETPHASDDEFDGTSLDGKWTAPASSGTGLGVTCTVGDGVLRMEPSASGSALTKRGGYGIRQAAPSGSFTVMAKVLDEMPTGDNARVGLFVGRSASSVATMIGWHTSAGWWAEAVGISSYSLTAEWGAYDGYQQVKSGVPMAAWFKIKYDASTSVLSLFVSNNGVFWLPIGTRSSYSQPTEIGLCMWSHEAANVADDHALWADWFRVTEP